MAPSALAIGASAPSEDAQFQPSFLTLLPGSQSYEISPQNLSSPSPPPPQLRSSSSPTTMAWSPEQGHSQMVQSQMGQSPIRIQYKSPSVAQVAQAIAANLSQKRLEKSRSPEVVALPGTPPHPAVPSYGALFSPSPVLIRHFSPKGFDKALPTSYFNAVAQALDAALPLPLPQPPLSPVAALSPARRTAASSPTSPDTNFDPNPPLWGARMRLRTRSGLVIVDVSVRATAPPLSLPFPVGSCGDVVLTWGDEAVSLLLSDVVSGGVRALAGPPAGVSLRVTPAALARIARALGGLLSLEFIDLDGMGPSGAAQVLGKLQEAVAAGERPWLS